MEKFQQADGVHEKLDYKIAFLGFKNNKKILIIHHIYLTNSRVIIRPTFIFRSRTTRL